MNRKSNAILGVVSALTAGILLLSPTRISAQEQGPEELTRGPVHEAFATSVGFNPEPGMIAKNAPPTLIEELPPDQRPEGDNVAWIPGYWAWDDEQPDFIWISGVWRNLPPDRQWVPGYWGDTGSQWQWTSGYWDDENSEEVAYLPQPPRSVESGPNIAAPSNNHSWIPGNWVHRENRYAWTPGYWEPSHANWIWTPAHYQWTRYGYIYVDGYWDYAVANRGVMFAPVRFHGDSYRRPGYNYTPLMVISLNVFLNHLFVRPSYGHYYFGDYYSPNYRDGGYYSSYSYNSDRRGYDPIYAYNRWDHRNDVNWERSRRENFEYYRDNESSRPPRTWANLQDRPEDRRKGGRDDFQIVQPLQTYAASREPDQRLVPVNTEGKEKMIEQGKKIREFSQKRQQIENRAPEDNSKTRDVKREKFTKSPLVAKQAKQMPTKEAPPKRLEPREPSEKQDKPSEKPDKPSEKQDKPTKKPDKPSEKPDKPSEKLDKPSEKLNKPSEKLDKPSEKLDMPREKLDKPTEKLDKPTKKPDMPREKRAVEDKAPPERTERPEIDRSKKKTPDEVKPEPRAAPGPKEKRADTPEKPKDESAPKQKSTDKEAEKQARESTRKKNSVVEEETEIEKKP